ncbi:MAG: UPF0179 family protein [Thermoplasmata archaeon]
MVLIALIGKRMAKPGLEFQFLGNIVDCRDCPLKNICFMLESGKYYRITNVRDKEHQCKIHDLNKVVTVEVEEIPVPIAINKKLALEGSTITFENTGCEEINCEYYDICNVLGLRDGTKVKVEKYIEDINCPKGKQISKVLVRW